MGGKDPGTYMNEGIQIAQRGSLVWTTRSSQPCRRPHGTVLPVTRQTGVLRRPLHGLLRDGPERGDRARPVPAPLSRVDRDWIRAERAQRRPTGVGAWTILGLVAVYLVGARLVGPVAAAIGAALLAMNVVVVWFARYPNSEVVMLALVFAALLALARALVDGDRYFGPVAGGLVGAAAVPALRTGLLSARSGPHCSWRATADASLGAGFFAVSRPCRCSLGVPVRHDAPYVALSDRVHAQDLGLTAVVATGATALAILWAGRGFDDGAGS